MYDFFSFFLYFNINMKANNTSYVFFENDSLRSFENVRNEDIRQTYENKETLHMKYIRLMSRDKEIMRCDLNKCKKIIMRYLEGTSKEQYEYIKTYLMNIDIQINFDANISLDVMRFICVFIDRSKYGIEEYGTKDLVIGSNMYQFFHDLEEVYVKIFNAYDKMILMFYESKYSEVFYETYEKFINHIIGRCDYHIGKMLYTTEELKKLQKMFSNNQLEIDIMKVEMLMMIIAKEFEKYVSLLETYDVNKDREYIIDTGFMFGFDHDLYTNEYYINDDEVVRKTHTILEFLLQLIINYSEKYKHKNGIWYEFDEVFDTFLSIENFDYFEIPLISERSKSEYVNGKREGKRLIYSPEFKWSKTYVYKNDMREGEFEYQFSTSKYKNITNGMYHNDELHGVITRRKRTKRMITIHTTTYVNGIREGKYDKCKYIYVKRKRNRRKILTYKKTGSYKNDEKYGKWIVEQYRRSKKVHKYVIDDVEYDENGTCNVNYRIVDINQYVMKNSKSDNKTIEKLFDLESKYYCTGKLTKSNDGGDYMKNGPFFIYNVEDSTLSYTTVFQNDISVGFWKFANNKGEIFTFYALSENESLQMERNYGLHMLNHLIDYIYMYEMPDGNRKGYIIWRNESNETIEQELGYDDIEKLIDKIVNIEFQKNNVIPDMIMDVWNGFVTDLPTLDEERAIKRLEELYRMGVPVPVEPHETTLLSHEHVDERILKHFSIAREYHEECHKSAQQNERELIYYWIYGDYVSFNRYIKSYNSEESNVEELNDEELNDEMLEYGGNELTNKIYANVIGLLKIKYNVEHPKIHIVAGLSGGYKNAYLTIRNMIFSLLPIDHKVYTWRGMHGGDEICDLEIGNHVLFYRFTACSVAFEVACEFANDGVLTLIELPKGANLLNLTCVKNSEPECLLPDRCVFQVVNILNPNMCNGVECRKLLHLRLLGVSNNENTKFEYNYSELNEQPHIDLKI